MAAIYPSIYSHWAHTPHTTLSFFYSGYSGAEMKAKHGSRMQCLHIANAVVILSLHSLKMFQHNFFPPHSLFLYF